MTGAEKGRFVPHQYRIFADKLACARHWTSTWNGDLQCAWKRFGNAVPSFALCRHRPRRSLPASLSRGACSLPRPCANHQAEPTNARGTAHLKPLLFLLLVGRGITAKLDARCGGARRRLAAVFHPADHLEKLVEVDLAVLMMNNYRNTTLLLALLAHEFRTPFLSTCSKMWTKLPTSPPCGLRGGLLAAEECD